MVISLKWMRPLLRKMNRRMLSNYANNPKMAKNMPLFYSRASLEKFAASKVMGVIRVN